MNKTELAMHGIVIACHSIGWLSYTIYLVYVAE